MLYHLNGKSILSAKQFGFLPGRSTHQSLFTVTKHIYSALNNNKIMGCIYLDIAKAFNCINHKMLYYKMYNAGLSKNMINWFKSYLSRTQTVCINNQLSTVKSVPAGIAQGTVLGLIFIFYINDVGIDLRHIRTYLCLLTTVYYICPETVGRLSEICYKVIGMSL